VRSAAISSRNIGPKRKTPAAIAAGGSFQSRTDAVQNSPVSSDVKQKILRRAFFDFFSTHYKTDKRSDDRRETFLESAYLYFRTYDKNVT
jgi:hypothetical protein